MAPCHCLSCVDDNVRKKGASSALFARLMKSTRLALSSTPVSDRHPNAAYVKTPGVACHSFLEARVFLLSDCQRSLPARLEKQQEISIYLDVLVLLVGSRWFVELDEQYYGGLNVLPVFDLSC